MKQIKHVGRLKKNGEKVLVAFRTLPGESGHCLVVPVALLSESYHDSIFSVVESDSAQEAFEFGEILFTRTFSDGRPMLQALTKDNILQKVTTDSVQMTPTPNTAIDLDQLNIFIAEQKNCAIDDLCNFVAGAPRVKAEETVEKDIVESDVQQPQKLQASENQPLSDKDIAKSYRSQADSMYKEAARLRREADQLDPPVKKAVTSKSKSEETADA